MKVFLIYNFGISSRFRQYLIRLLKQSGIKVFPIILSTSSNGRLHYDVPFIKQFNYILPLVADDKGVFFCDATLKCAPYYLIPSKCLNGHGFLVDKQQPQFVEIADISQTSSDYNIKYNFNTTLDSVSIHVKLEASGYDALRLREYLLKDDTLSIMKELFTEEKDVSFKYDGNIKDEDYNKPLNLSFTLKKEVILRNNKIYFNPFICEKITVNPFKSTERKYPIDYRYKRRIKTLVTIELPKDHSLESFPESKTSITTDKAVKYNFTLQNNGILIQAMSEYIIENPEIKANGYLDLKNLYNDMVISQSEYFVFSKSTK